MHHFHTENCWKEGVENQIVAASSQKVPCRGSLCPPICSSSFVEATGTRKPLAFYWSPLVHILLYDLKHEEIKIAVGW